ncbi:hypothetical protein EGR_08930 [Echinococcus granulosus]|uniref:Uncharacterized protein n=1 Tax=Echinococcus granulosus TaxID=6210 RepID=W6U4Y7_ECHGR|nr:hypothetical protein EGR_08930 [Echinococcus granulosus]EUB56228.1 hypothetical protein EGR_08930 [Echinococcus granulosus]
MEVLPEGEQNPPVTREMKGTSKSLTLAVAAKRPNREDAKLDGVGDRGGGGGRNPLLSDFSSLIRKKQLLNEQCVTNDYS